MTTIPRRQKATIASGQSLSGAVLVSGRVLWIEMPAAWTAADLTFQISHNGEDYYNAYDTTNSAGTEVDFKVAAGNAYIPKLGDLPEHVRYLKIRSGTSGTPVAQGADRELWVVSKEYA